jgi:hypothetical protein
MSDEKVTNEEVRSLRRIYEVLLRDAADVYADLQQGIDARREKTRLRFHSQHRHKY